MKELEQLVEINEESCMRIARNAVRAFEREIARIKEAVKNSDFDADTMDSFGYELKDNKWQYRED